MALPRRPDAPAVEGRSCATAGPIARRRRRASARGSARSTPRPPAGPSRGPRSRPTRIFHDIRLEPYLRATARAHPTLAPALRRLARRTRDRPSWRWCMATSARRTSCSGPTGPVFLDAECAWYGDPAFDLAFCLNHLLLKCLWTPGGGRRASSPASTRLVRDLSRAASTGSRARELEARAAALLPGAVPRPGRRQVAGRVRHRRGRQGAGAARCARSFLQRPAAIAGRCAAGLGGGAGACECHAITHRCAGAGSGTPAAGRRSRPRCTRRRRHRPGDRAGRRLDRQRRGGRPARRRRRLRRPRRDRRGGERERRDRPRAARARRRRPGGDRRPPDRARRHARQAAARRQRHHRHVDGGGPCRRGRRRAAALAPSRSREAAGRCRCPRSRSSAAARMPARRIDIQDFMVVCPGAPTLRRRRWTGRPRSTAPPGELMARARAAQGRRRRGRLLARLRLATRRRSRCSSRAIERAGFGPGERGGDRARRRRLASSAATAATGWARTARARHATA